MTDSEKELYRVFKEIGITDYEIHEHPAVFTTEEAKEAGLVMPGLNLKNLLVKDKKDGRYFLVILTEERRMHEKEFRHLTGWSKIRFATAEELFSMLQLTPGSVSPFGLIHDQNHLVSVVLDKRIGKAPEKELVNFHPNRNTATLSLSKGDFMKFLHETGNTVFLED